MSDIHSTEFTRIVLVSEIRWNEALRLLLRLNQHKSSVFAIEEQTWTETVQLCLSFVTAGKGDELKEMLDRELGNRVQTGVDELLASASRSALVFGHAVLEAAIADLLRLSIKIDHRSLLPQIQDKKISVKELLASDVSTTILALTHRYLEQVDRESLLARLRLLLAICKPESSVFADEMYPEFSFDESRIESIDKLRHQVVHELKAGATPIEDILYMKYVTRVVFRMFSHRYGTQLNRDESLRFFSERARGGQS